MGTECPAPFLHVLGECGCPCAPTPSVTDCPVGLAHEDPPQDPPRVTFEARDLSPRPAVVASDPPTGPTTAAVHEGAPTALSWSEYVAELEMRGAPAVEEHGLWCPPDCSCGFTIPDEVEDQHPLIGVARRMADPAFAAMYLALDDADGMLHGEGALHRFLIGAWHIIEPGVTFEDGPLVEAVCDHIQRQLEERAVAAGIQQPPAWLGWTGRMRAQDLLIRQPPRTLKTVISGIAATAWAWLRWPTMRILYLSSNPRVSADAADRVRSLIRSSWYQQTFSPQWRLREDQDALAKLGNTAGGWRAARGITSRITGEGCDWMLIDDPHDGAEVFSKAKRDAVNGKWSRSVSSRVNDPRLSIRLGVMQALHYQDWGEARIAEGWGLLLIRMEYEPSRPRKKVGEHGVYVEPDDVRVSPYGWKDWRIGQPSGTTVSPRFTAEWCAAEKKNPLVWSAQKQQDPAPIDGGLIKAEHLSYYEELPTVTDGWAITVDASFKKTDTGSRVSVQVWCRKGPDRFLVDNVTQPDDLPGTIKTIKALLEKWPRAKSCILIEDKANGSACVATLRTEMPCVIEVNPGNDSKEARLMACLGLFYGRNVYIPKNAPWREDLIAEWTQFPNWPKNDQVDAAVQLLLHWTVSSAAMRARAACTL